MPRVGKKHFPYTPEGYAAAKKARAAQKAKPRARRKPGKK